MTHPVGVPEIHHYNNLLILSRRLLCHGNELNTYTVFGHNFVKKLVCVKPRSCQPNVRAGAPAKQ